MPLFKRRPRNLEAEDVDLDVDFELQNSPDSYQLPWTDDAQDYIEYSDATSFDYI